MMTYILQKLGRHTPSEIRTLRRTKYYHQIKVALKYVFKKAREEI